MPEGRAGDAPRGARRVRAIARWAALRTLIAFSLVFGSAAVTASWIADRAVASLPPTSGSIWTRYYIGSALEELPEIADREDPIAIAVGASQTYYGFFPPAFDSELAGHGESVTSYNMALLGWTPFTVRLWTRRIVAALETEKKRARVFLVGFTPHLMTEKTAEHGRWETINLPAQAQFSGWREVAMVARSSPDQASRLLSYRLFGVTPSLMREITTQRMLGEPFRRALRSEWSLPEGFPSWPADTRGGQKKFVEYESDEDRRKLMNRHFRARVRQSGLLSLRFDPSALEHVVQTARLAAKVSDHVFVVVPPRNSEIVKTSDEALSRLDEALARVAEESGATVLNYYADEERFALADFIDATHLAGDEPRERFSRMLARDVADHVESQRVALRVER